MSDYISRDRLYELGYWHGATPTLDNPFPDGVDAVDTKYIDSIPAADVVKVVRCKDCRHRDPEDHKCDCGQLERAGCVFPVNDNYFCAYGEE